MYSLFAALFLSKLNTLQMSARMISFLTLASIWVFCDAERRSNLARAERLAMIAGEAADRAAAVSRARERPIDLTDDIVGGGSDTE